MKVSDFDYELPGARIAQEPEPRRDASRLMVLDRVTGRVRHRVFTDLPEWVSAPDVVVLNDTRVLPARLTGKKPTGGRVELFLLERNGDGRWWCLVRASKSTPPGTLVELGNGVRATIEARDDDRWLVVFETRSGNIDSEIERLGTPPLPPYIRREPDDPRGVEDRDRYQTIYARQPGAVAAPTAGLHFTRELLGRLEQRGVRLAWLTLHVGLGTFQPVRVEDVERHHLHAESYDLPEPTAAAIAETRERGGRVVAVGTTVTRVLESRADDGGRVRPGSGRCDLFIYPGHTFSVVDTLLTNFHLPRSTLLMLVCAFAGKTHTLDAYREAIERGYRFYSYGDAMVVGSFA
ncbi:MAG: tRNA preQ1(34) S-adenosylmethionine ribosyltransferase-isomerase QueA [Acidobacteriota bacterium]|nr:tRNA preQ1(34) S-adenosylmethionine ribosyltransferase-isomerase QueA [Acidobacteriota bacterium]